MNEIQKILHVGIYGILNVDDKILVVKKSRGPYKNLFDLPGGKPYHGENLLDALKREFLEETNILIKKCTLINNFSFLISYLNEKNENCQFYHIALLYLIDSADTKKHNPTIAEEDVFGCLWININQLSEKNSSPLLLKTMEIL